MSVNNPKISVIIPSFNQGEYIEETIVSILNQDYKNFEIILIDGGSTDNTLSVIKKYAGRLTYWISEKDKGQSDAINKGLKVASGQVITWLNSDDFYEKKTLEIVANAFLNDPALDILHGKSLLFGEKIKSKIIGLTTDIALNEYLPYMRFPQPSSFLKSKWLNAQSPVNEHLHYAMDFELVSKAILLGAKIKRIDNILSNYRLHTNSKSNLELKFFEEWTEVVINTLRSIKNGNAFANKLNKLGLAKSEVISKYQCEVSFTEKEISTIFLQHLHLHYHYNYRQCNYKICHKISTYLKENYKDFYVENHFNKYNNRLKFIPKFVFIILRGLQK
ncbi:MAG: glycosyltransferase family 2 protein [Bacteroidia bacterium]